MAFFMRGGHKGLVLMKKPQLIENQLRFYIESTQSRDRTGMEVNPLVFETSASTNSAIWAFDLFSNAWQRYGFFLNAQTFDYFFLNIIQRQIKSQIIYLALYLFEYIKST